MSVGRICHTDVDSAQPWEGVRAAAQRMESRGVGTLVVLDEERRPIGILTDRDVALRVVGAGWEPHETLVEDVMTPDPHSIDAETSVEDALFLMRTRLVRRLIVVDADGTLVGVLSLDDILGLLAEELSEVGRFLQKSPPHRTVGR